MERWANSLIRNDKIAARIVSLYSGARKLLQQTNKILQANDKWNKDKIAFPRFDRQPNEYQDIKYSDWLSWKLTKL